MFRFKSIIPEKFNLKALLDLFRSNSEDILEEIYLDFVATAETFENPPEFRKLAKLTINSLSLEVFTDDENYLRLSRGVPSRSVTLSEDKKAFRLPETYTAKTIPGVLRSRRGGPSPNFRFVRTSDRKLTVGAITPRRFELTVLSKYKGRLPKDLQKALEDSVKVSGHEIRG